MGEAKLILCPVCKNRTRSRIHGDTNIGSCQLFCPKFKQEKSQWGGDFDPWDNSNSLFFLINSSSRKSAALAYTLLCRAFPVSISGIAKDPDFLEVD